MKNVAILTTENLEGFFVYDTLLDDPFSHAGWQTHPVSWREKDVNWNNYDVVIVRSTWDYQQDQAAFVDCLKEIEASTAVLENPLSLMLWNVDKSYLQTLEAQSIPIVPTLWYDSYDSDMTQRAYTQFDTDNIVVKPTISANADHTYRLSRADDKAKQQILSDVFANRRLMVQPFLPAIISPGEYSLFYFDGHYSHSILKTPKAQDFRVQEEHGGQLKTVTPSEEMKRLATQTVNALPAPALYARIDLVEAGNGFAVIEVEVIEPSLYFNMDPASPQRFVDRFCKKYGASVVE